MKFLAAMLMAGVAFGAEPVRTAWIMGAGGFHPDVQAVEAGEQEVVVRSGGISLRQLGPLGMVPQPREQIRQFVFQFPVKPQREAGRHAHVPSEYTGAFLNGVPVYNQFEAASYRGQNLWHYDQIARNRESARPGLIEALIPDTGRHSPIIGFALDGFPIYGPWGFSAGLKRMRSSYRLRNMTVRDRWPDSTRLAPGQYGPPVDAQYPAGSFVEDYEYVTESGDLDEYNGRFGVTPDYPDGTYAYFLTTDDSGSLAFPYLLASQFAGKFKLPETGQLVRLRRPENLEAGKAVVLELDGLARYLEYVHERPIHLLIVSDDLAEFDHIHPEVNEQGIWQVPYTFAHGGRYRVYADYTPPGANQRLESFDVTVAGAARARVPLGKPDFVLRAGEDTELEFDAPRTRLQPYLGAWAHVVIAGEGLKSFVHAHPLEEGNSLRLNETHSHSAEALGPAPERVHVPVSFPAAGLYKVWVQFQVAGQVVTRPYIVSAEAGRPRAAAKRIPAGAVTVHITPHGFEPARVQIPAGRAVTLAFVRSGDPNCGARVVFPELGISHDIPLGGVALIPLPAVEARELMFGCGMGMYRGSVVVSAAPIARRQSPVPVP